MVQANQTIRAIQDVETLLVQTGAMDKIRAANMQGFIESALQRIATNAIDDFRKHIHDLSYDLVNEVRELDLTASKEVVKG